MVEMWFLRTTLPVDTDYSMFLSKVFSMPSDLPASIFNSMAQDSNMDSVVCVGRELKASVSDVKIDMSGYDVEVKFWGKNNLVISPKCGRHMVTAPLDLTVNKEEQELWFIDRDGSFLMFAFEFEE